MCACTKTETGGIVALSPSDCELLCALGAESQICARGSTCDYPESIKSIPDVGAGEMLNIESVVKLHPNYVTMSKSGYTLAQVEALRNAGIDTRVYDVQSLDDVYAYIEDLGKICNTDSSKMIADMKTGFESIPKLNKRVVLQVAPEETWISGAGTFQDDIVKLLGCENVFSDCRGWVQVSDEQIAARHPDLIIRCYEDDRFMRPGPRLVDAAKDLTNN